MDAGSWQAWHEWTLSKITNCYKWEALISFLGEKELSPSLLSNTVYQRIELTYQTGPQSVYASRALCIIVLRSEGSDLSVILRGSKKGLHEERNSYFLLILMHVLYHAKES